MSETFARERDRCVDRLRTMPLGRLPESAALAYEACTELLQLTPGGEGRALPRLADRAAGDQLAVIAADFAAAGPDDAALALGTEVLTRLRRSLP